MNDGVRVGVGVLLLGWLLVAAIGGAGVATAGDPPAAIATAAADDDGNETVPHRHPDEYEAESDQAALESWLADRLADRLEESTIALDDGEYDRAQELVGDEYRDRFEQYVEVTGETAAGDDETDDETDEAFEEAAAEQARLAALIEQYEETAAEYEAAREAGDDEQARALARDLEELAAEIEAAGGTVMTRYENLTRDTDRDLTESIDTVNESVTTVEQTQTIVREEQFIETELVLEPVTETGSFVDPIRLRGELRTADGAALANESVRLAIDGDPIDVRTDATGALAVDYRPTTQPLGATPLTVAYVPDVQSPYLGSETTVDVTIEQVEPTIAALETAETTAYNESLHIAGTLSAADIPVDGVDLEARLDGTPVGTLTVTNGTFAEPVAVPAAVPAGERSLTVALPGEDRALAATAATTAIRVAETPTELRVEATPIDDAEYRVEGTLSADGAGVANQSVAIRVDGTSVATVTTDATGSFAERVTVPTAEANASTVTAEYDDPETSLAATRAETTVGAPGERASWLDRVGSAPALALGLAGLLALALGGVWWWRRDRAGSAPETGDPTGDPVAAPSAAGAPRGGVDPDRVDAALAHAADQLDAGRPDAAVRTAYAAVRQAWRPPATRAETLTHWEFFDHYDDDGTASDDRGRLRDVTAAYERAAFTPESVTATEAAAALDAARHLCDAATPADRSAPRDDPLAAE